jgi:hypothetical protein
MEQSEYMILSVGLGRVQPVSISCILGFSDENGAVISYQVATHLCQYSCRCTRSEHSSSCGGAGLSGRKARTEMTPRMASRQMAHPSFSS